MAKYFGMPFCRLQSILWIERQGMTTDIAVVDSFDDDDDDDGTAAAPASTVSIQCREHLCVVSKPHTWRNMHIYAYANGRQPLDGWICHNSLFHMSDSLKISWIQVKRTNVFGVESRETAHVQAKRWISIIPRSRLNLTWLVSLVAATSTASHAQSDSLWGVEVCVLFHYIIFIWCVVVVRNVIGLMQIFSLTFVSFALFRFNFFSLLCFFFSFSLSLYFYLRSFSCFLQLLLILLHFNSKIYWSICEFRVHQFYTFKCCIGFGRGITPSAQQTSPVRRANSPDHPNPALAITEVPSPPIAKIGWALRVLLLTDSSSCLKDRKVCGLWHYRKKMNTLQEKTTRTKTIHAHTPTLPLPTDKKKNRENRTKLIYENKDDIKIVMAVA